MQKNYSENDLLNYIYKETSHEESSAIAAAIDSNELLKAQYLELLQGIDLLNKTYLRPSEVSLANILNKAKDGLQQNVD